MALCGGFLIAAHAGLLISVILYGDYVFARTVDREDDLAALFRERVIPCFNWAFGGFISLGVIAAGLSVSIWITELLAERYGETPPISANILSDGIFVLLAAVLAFFLRRDAYRSA